MKVTYDRTRTFTNRTPRPHSDLVQPRFSDAEDIEDVFYVLDNSYERVAAVELNDALSELRDDDDNLRKAPILMLTFAGKPTLQPDPKNLLQARWMHVL